MKRILIGCLSAAIVVIAGCDDKVDEAKVAKPAAVVQKPAVEPASPPTPKTPPIPEWNKSISDQATLVEYLPQDALLYMRIPNIWGLLNTPKQNSLHAALSSEANQAGVQKLQKGAATLVQNKFGPMAPVINLLSANLRSPLELAVVGGQSGDPATIQLVVGARLAYESMESFNDALQKVASTNPLAKWVKPAGDQEPGQIMAGPATLRFSFDAATQRLLLVAGLGLSSGQFTAIQGWEKPGQPHPIEKLESRIDSERSGLFVWSNVELATPILKPTMPPHLVAALDDLGVLSTRQFGFGFGSSSGKGRFLVAADGDKGTVWDLALSPVAIPTFNTAGIPDALLAINLPEYPWVMKLINEIAKQEGKDPKDILDEANAGLVKNLGVDLKTLVDGISGSYFFVFDKNGSYVVHQGAQSMQQKSLEKAFTEKFEASIEQKTVQGVAITHLVMPPIMNNIKFLEQDKRTPENLKAILSMYGSMNNHIYWITEGNNRIYADVPQVLLDRSRYPLDVKLSEWLKKTGADYSHTLLYVLANMDNIPRINYYSYLNMLNALGDIFEQPLDLSEFPSARELGLPESGIFSLQLDYADQQLGVGLTYESHPAEILYGSGGVMGAVAITGILAAIAIPAYEDYTVRAEVTAALVMASPLKRKVELYIQTEGVLPEGEVAEQFKLPVRNNVVDAIYYDEKVRAIVLDFSDKSRRGAGSAIHYFPEVNEQTGRLVWRCQGKGGLNEKHLPPSCR